MVGCGSLVCVAGGTEREAAGGEKVEAESRKEPMVAAIVVGAKAAVARAAVARAAETVAAGTAVGRLGAQMEEEVRERERVERGRGGAEKVSLAVLRGLVEVVVTVVAVVARALVAVVEGATAPRALDQRAVQALQQAAHHLPPQWV